MWFFFRIIHFVIEAGLRCGDWGGGGLFEHGSTSRVISVPTQKGQQVRTLVSAPSYLLISFPVGSVQVWNRHRSSGAQREAVWRMGWGGGGVGSEADFKNR